MQILLSLLGVLQIVQLCVTCLDKELSNPSSVVAIVVCLLSTVILIGLSSKEHTHCVSPSDILAVYFLVSFAFGVVQARTLWMIADTYSIPIIYSIILPLELAIVVAESLAKNRSLQAPYNEYPASITTGFLGRCFLWWLNPLLLLGFRQRFQVQDLFEMESSMTCRSLYTDIVQKWMNGERPILT